MVSQPHVNGNGTPLRSELTASNLFFSPLPPDHEPPVGKAHHGRYMLTIPWSMASGWGQARIEPRKDLTVDPLSGVIQYAVTCFEGMKCYTDEQGGLRLFRPNKNFDRFKRSAARLGLPCEWDNDELIDLLCKLLALEKPMAPTEDGSSIYIRPTLLETSEGWGIKESAYASEALLIIVTSLNLGLKAYPSAEKHENGLRLDACQQYIRAWPGGTGSYKLGANYGTVGVAKRDGFHMSLWLHQVNGEDYLSEAGAMNVWIIREAEDGVLEFVTMGLDNGIVLPGITRESIIELLNDHASGKKEFPLEGMPKNIRVVERDISMKDITQGIADGSVKGMFGSGTGVVVVAIKEIEYEGKLYTIPYNPLVLLLRNTITGLHRGRIPHDWSYPVPEWTGGLKAEKKQANGEEMMAA